MKFKPASGDAVTDRRVLSLGFSPCPNDTFMFDALVNGKLNAKEITFNVRLEDIQTLNILALNRVLDITKISFAAYPLISSEYQLLTSGSALGMGVGPLFISKKKFDDISQIKTVAIPGFNTTAYFLFKKFYPSFTNVREYVFSKIEDALLNEEADAGIIIHENRFTYAKKGLIKIADLGDLWQNETGLPIPLGAIAIRRSIDEESKHFINEQLKKSIQHAMSHPDDSRDYVHLHSQELSEEITKQHIDLYVNEYSVELNEKAKEAVFKFLNIERANQSGIFV